MASEDAKVNSLEPYREENEVLLVIFANTVVYPSKYHARTHKMKTADEFVTQKKRPAQVPSPGWNQQRMVHVISKRNST